MNRTTATKMIVMSSEFRTRGSMPGASRSESITRSSALVAIHPPPEKSYALARMYGGSSSAVQRGRVHARQGAAVLQGVFGLSGSEPLSRSSGCRSDSRVDEQAGQQGDSLRERGE